MLNHPITPCSIEGCEKPAKRRGWCQTHYHNWRMRGDALLPRRPTLDSLINKNGPTPEHRPDLGPCWIYLGGLNNGGYGRHTKVYEKHVGPVPAGHELDHLCRVRKCVNPAHLQGAGREGRRR